MRRFGRADHGPMTTTQQAFFFGALISAVVCAAIASHKNRSTVVWALLGFLFGVIPGIICAVLPSRRTSY